MSKFYFDQYQNPVGQGGFQKNYIYENKNKVLFSWIFDCGSNQAPSLHREIKALPHSNFNALFLSHLDNDHVNGVDLLLKTCHVDEVVLPYLSDDNWLFHLAAAIAGGNIADTFIDLVEEPEVWFGTRGVRKLTYVECENEDDDTILKPDPVTPSPHETGDEDIGSQMELVWTRSEDISSKPISDKDLDRANVYLVPKGAIATIIRGTHTINWILSPFSFQVSSKNLKRFRSELIKVFGSGLTLPDYAAKARTHTGRMQLRACYDSIIKAHNKTSLVLYSGPFTYRSKKIHNTAWVGHFIRRAVQPGWISMGDYDCSKSKNAKTISKRCKKMVEFYSLYSDIVGQISLPHHGSDLSFDPTILSSFPNCHAAIAAVGPNIHGHPGIEVQHQVGLIKALQFVRVDENPSSVYRVFGFIG